MALIKFSQVSKKYQVGELTISALSDINFEVEEGECVIIVGPSGAGKTTLLNLIGGMDQASSGDILVNGQNIAKYNNQQLTNYRRNDIGFVFQFYNLIGNLTALENVEMATQISKKPLNAKDILAQVGLAHRLHNFPSQLSGGEQQRVSIARALAKNPTLLLCDEPTGALDSTTGQQILQLLQNAAFQQHKTVIIITHNSDFAKIANRVITVKDGHIDSIYRNDEPISAASLTW